MQIVDEKQNATAAWLAGRLSDASPGRDALWHVFGAVGSGKTNVLRRLAEQLRRARLAPLLISAPAGEVDCAAIALLETTEQLAALGWANGDLAVVNDPKRCWTDKMAAVTRVIDERREEVVVLCDEPTRWYHYHDLPLDETPDYAARAFAEWIARDADCRRVISGRIPDDIPPREATRAPRLSDSRVVLAEDDAWGALRPYARELDAALPEPVPSRSVWNMRLCVALCVLKGGEEAAQAALSEVSADALLREFLDLVERDPGYADFCAALARLAVARTALDRRIVCGFIFALPPVQRSLVERCLLDWELGHAALHPLVRDEVLRRATDPHHRESNQPWRLAKNERLAIHRNLAAQYPFENGSPLRNSLESLHHELLGGETHLDASDARLKFVEQLHAIGRSLSHAQHEHRRAADLFRFALQFDPEHPYSHHYLAFNLDWLAEEPEAVENHYQKAIQFQSTHPWWWSRWISYLATRGRLREAKVQWREAVDALSISEDSPDWIFRSLHRWVARWLLHWAELDFAEEVLRSIPKDVANSDTSVQTLWNLLRALRQAEQGTSVFPLTVPAADWWSPSPHTDLPPEWNGRPLGSWVPARVEGVDDEAEVAYLTAAKRPATRHAEPEYYETELSRNAVAAAAHGFAWSDLGEGRYIELGYYGEVNELRVGLHRETQWQDPNLLPLVPPTDRWYSSARAAEVDSYGSKSPVRQRSRHS